MLFWQFSTHKIYATVRGKLSELHYNALLVSNRGEKVMKRRKTMGQICPIVFRAFWTFSPRLENNKSSKCGSENFPRMLTYILCVENCQNNILTHSCLPIAGTLFYIVRHFHAPRIWECTISETQNNPAPRGKLKGLDYITILALGERLSSRKF